jgi:hypothetical protein
MQGPTFTHSLYQVLTSAGALSPRSLTLSLPNNDIALAAEAETGTSVFGRSGGDYGTTTYFPFSFSGDTIGNATSFSAGGQSFPINGEIFIVPSLTSLSDRTLNATIATLASASCDNLALHIAAPFPQAGSLAPRISTKEIGPGTLVRKTGLVDGYTICETSLQLDGLSTGAIVIKASIGGKVIDSLLVDRGVAGW